MKTEKGLNLEGGERMLLWGGGEGRGGGEGGRGGGRGRGEWRGKERGGEWKDGAADEDGKS